MRFLDTFELVASTLSPVHIGCGEDFIPTEYVVDSKGTLHRFNPEILAAPGNTSIMADISKAMNAGDGEKQLHGVHTALQRHREKIISHSSGAIPMCPGVFDHYKKTQDSLNDFNRNGIERTAFNSIDQTPYLPGSSIKGAIRTALINARSGGRSSIPRALQQQIAAFNAMIDEYHRGDGRVELRLKNQFSKRDYEAARRDIEKSIAKAASNLSSDLLGGSFETDPLRALKIGDAFPTNNDVDRKIRFCLNRSRSGRRSQAQSKNLYTRLEYLIEHQPAAFGLSASLHNLQSVAGHRNHRDAVDVPLADHLLSWPEIVKACNQHYLPLLESDIRTVQKLLPASAWAATVSSTLAAGLRSDIDGAECMLLRIGKHGGADSNTVDGRQIKIMLNEDKRPGRDGRVENIRLYVFDIEPRTTWFCGEDLNNPTDLLPHGWIVLGRRDRQWYRNLPGYERQQNRKQIAAESARRQAEIEAAAQAEAAARAAHEEALAQMTPNLRRIEEFKTACALRAEQLMGNKDNPNTAFHQIARELAKAASEGTGWTSDERSAAADAIEEWLPKLVRIEIKDERRKLKLAALRSG